jgi:uncharacterized damage-inducible protein DinB
LEFLKQLEYHIWAETEFYNSLEGLDADIWKKIHPELQKSLQGIYTHKVEVMWFWFQLMKQIEPIDTPDFEKMEKKQLFSLMFDLFEELRKFLNTTSEVKLRLDFPMLKEPYQVTSYELLFNILNHHSYHRGQIAMLLKKYDFSFPETDYNPYMYQKLDLLTRK